MVAYFTRLVIVQNQYLAFNFRISVSVKDNYVIDYHS